MALAGRGHRVRIVSSVPVEHLPLPFVCPPDAGRLPAPQRRLVSAAALCRLLASERADLFHVHYAADYGAWAAWLTRRRPLVVTAMGSDVLFSEQGSQGPLGRWLTRAVLHAAGLVTCETRYLHDALRRLGVAEDRLLSILWGIDVQRFHPAADDTALLRRHWQLAADDLVIFSPRVLDPLYHQHLMIDALPAILRHHPKALLLVSRFGAVASYEAALRRQVARLGVAGRVRFLPAADADGMAQLYRLADIVVSLAASDGLPRTLLEAAASGCAMVIADLARYRELFTPGLDCRPVALEAAAVAAGCLDLLGDAASRHRLGQAARQTAERVCDLNADLDLLEQRMHALLA
jgi:glycosyltransferase involved in cell wall biosynthesis